MELTIPADKIEVFPNGTDLTRFYPRDRIAMRAKLGLPADKFLVAFVGRFLSTKGVQEAAAALEKLEGVRGVFVGDGPCRPKGRNVLFADVLPHEQVPELLSAADIFLLPTYVEGSCNAIVEAMACGLPVVTSCGEFNDDLVDNRLSVRVEPQDVDAICKAIVLLRDHTEVRRQMSAAAVEKAQTLDIRRRAHAILNFMAFKV